ncbi:MAG: hypothetical protein AAGA60_04100 [Cyanobacteria bacterium P01_E01_bin.42]
MKEQKEILRPVIHLLKEYKIVVIADREFSNVKSTNWLIYKGIGYIIRVKKGRYFREKDKEYKHLSSLGLAQGKSFFYSHDRHGMKTAIAIAPFPRIRRLGDRCRERMNFPQAKTPIESTGVRHFDRNSQNELI